jgi:hypothetical protein
LSQDNQKYISDKLNRSVEKDLRRYAIIIERELSSVDLIEGTTVYDVVRRYNADFIHSMLRADDRNDHLSVVEGGNVTSQQSMTVDGILKKWDMSTRNGGMFRDDTHGRGAHSTMVREAEIDYTEPAQGGYAHYDDFMGSVRAMNETDRPHELSRLGNNNIANDARLATREIYRDGNKIPNYEQRLYRRRYETDVGETLSSTEYGSHVRSHDMSDLW